MILHACMHAYVLSGYTTLCAYYYMNKQYVGDKNENKVYLMVGWLGFMAYQPL